MRRLVVSFALSSLCLVVSIPAGAHETFDPPSDTDSAPHHHGIRDTHFYYGGHLVATFNPDHINCLGHAAGLNAAVHPGTAPLSETLEALGYECRLADHEILLGDIWQGREVIMVYLALYKIPWRSPVDQVLSYAELADKYGWTEDAWKQPYVFFDREGASLPIDFHALLYNADSNSWDWVAECKPKDEDGSHTIDSVRGEAATQHPDKYFPKPRTLVSLACTR